MNTLIKLMQQTATPAAIVLLATCACTQAQPITSPIKQTSCANLKGMNIAANAIGLPTHGATVTSAILKPGTGSAVPPADFVPEFCMIDGVIESVDANAPNINFRVAVPSNWNGNAIQIGGNGFNGFIPRLASLIRGSAGSPVGPTLPPNRPFPIAQGYATFGSDSGHQNPGGHPPGWTPNTSDDGDPPLPVAVGAPGEGAQGGPPPGFSMDWMMNREALHNYAHEQIKKTHDVAQHLIVALRGKSPRHTYFMGESQGGRDALMAATMYGGDYDGVSVSVPLAFFTSLQLNTTYLAKLQLNPAAYIPPTKEEALAKFVLTQCDAMDGLADGVINNYMSCYKRFDVTLTPKPFAQLRCAEGVDSGKDCFSDAQIGTLEKTFSPMVYGFPMRNGETDWPGNAIGAKGVATGGLGKYLLRAPPEAKPDRVISMYQMILGPGRSFDYFNRTPLELKPELQEISAILDASTDFSKLFKHGGKLILHSAGNDYLTNPRSHMRVYEQALVRHGKATIDKSMRFYVTPNGNHGSMGVNSLTGEPTPQHMDLITALTDWVEKGITPPDALAQTFMKKDPPYEVVRSRPLCRYPMYPRYQGSGSPDAMSSYRCQLP